MALVATAQTGVLKKSAEGLDARHQSAQKGPAKIDAADNQRWWGYVSADADLGGLGVGSAETYDCAIFIPGTEAVAVGKDIKAVRFALQATHAINVKVWVAESLPTAITASKTKEIVNVTNLEQGINDVAFTMPHTVGTEGIYVGYSFTINDASTSADQYPVCITGDPMTNSLCLRTSRTVTTWQNLNDYGRLYLQVLLEGDFYEYAVQPQNYGNVIVPFGGSKDVPFTVTNTGTAKMTSIDYVLTIDGVDGAEQHVTFDSGVDFGSSARMNVTFNSADEEKIQDYVLTVTKVNGVENEQADAFVSGQVASTTRQIVKRVVIEEFTGTGCGWCPRGYIAMEKIRATFGDQVVPIAIHQYNSDDAMYISYANYASLSFTGAPECTLDRTIYTDPYYGTSSTAFGIASDIEQMAASPVEVGVEVSAMWSEDNTKVDATASLTSFFGGSQYDVEFVLIGDGLTGNTSAWYQSNYYYSYTAAQGGADMAPFCRGGEYGQSQVKGLHFNDVALSSSYVNRKNQVETVTLTAGEDGTAAYSLSLPTKATLKNAIDNDNLYVAALVIDPATKAIVNAAKAKVEEYDPTTVGITTTAVDAHCEVARFAADGRQIVSTQKGLNIVRMADGTTRKVIVR